MAERPGAIPQSSPTPPARPRAARRGLLDWIEWLGNKLPDPAMLFVIGAVVVMGVSWLAVRMDWRVQPRAIRQAFEPVVNAAGEPVLHEGRPRIRPKFDEDGQPVLELVADERRVVAVSVPGEGEEGEAVYVLEGEARERPVIRPQSLLTSEGLYWCLRTMVANFMAFPPLGVVLTGMLGIGIAERSGLLAAALRAFVLVVPRALLTPTMIFLGVMSSMGIDCGYVVLPPLAAALYISVGRSPLVGIAAVFAGVAAGFNANLLVTGLDPMLAQLSTIGAQVIDPEYQVAPTCNWWFMIASTFLITLTGWLTTAWFVEHRFSRKSAEEGGPRPVSQEDLAAAAGGHSLVSGVGVFLLFVLFVVAAVGPLAVPSSPFFAFRGLYEVLASGLSAQGAGLASLGAYFSDLAEAAPRVAASGASVWAAPPLWLKLCIPVAAGVFVLPWFVYALAFGGMKAVEARGLALATAANSLIVGGVAILATMPGSPLYGKDTSGPFDRWIAVIVPLIFFAFLVPGVVYGLSTGKLRGGRDVAKMMTESMAGMAPIIVLAFFAAQFIEYFKYSRLDVMLAHTGGQALAAAALPAGALMVAFILLTGCFNLLVGSMSAKYTMFAPIFVPMFMMVGVSPELTQAAYRIGDSVTNVITPLNAYLVIVLVYIQKYFPKAGIGTLISMMVPYTLTFLVVWTILLVAWIQMGWDLGVGGPLVYSPAG